MSECKYCGIQIIGSTPEPHTCISCYNKRARFSSQSEQHSSNVSSNLLVDTVACCACGKPMSILDSDDLNFCNECLKLKIDCEKCGKTFVPIGSGNCPHCTPQDNSPKNNELNPYAKTNMGYKYLQKEPFYDTNTSSSRFNDKKVASSPNHNISTTNSEHKNKEKPNKSYKDLLKKLFSDNKPFTSSLNETKKEKIVEDPSGDYRFVKCRECGIEFVPRQHYYHTCPRCFQNSSKKPSHNHHLKKGKYGNGLNDNDSTDDYFHEKEKIKKIHDKDLFNKIIRSYESSISRIILYGVRESTVPLTSERLLQVIQGIKSDYINNNQLNQLHSYSILPNIIENQFELIIKSLIKNSFLMIDEQSIDDNIIITKEGTNFLEDSNNIMFGFWDEFNKTDGKKDSKIFDSIDLPHRLLNDPKSVNRTHIAYLLGETRDPQYVDCLCKATKDPKGNVRIASASALGKIGEIKAENSLIELLKDPKQQARTNAVRALGKLNSKKGLSLIKNMKTDESPYVVREVELVLSKLHKDVSTPESLDGSKTSEQVFILLNDIDSRNRAHAAFLLGETKDKQFVDVLCKATLDKEPNVRRLSASALGKIGDPKSKNALLKLLTDPKPQVRQYSAKALGKIGSKNQIVSTKSSEHSRNTVKNGKSISFEKSKETSAIDIDESSKISSILLYDPHSDKRAQAAYSLGNKKDPKYLDVLCKATKDESANVRRLAVVALGKIGDKRAEETFIQLLKDPEPYTRQYAIIGLGKIGSKKALPYIRKLTNDSVLHVRQTAYKTLSILNEN
mgnify:CR=1 FL=1